MLLREYRIEAGLSPEDMPRAMRRAGIDTRYIPSARTIRRVEDEGIVPQVRFQFGLARFFSRPMANIWSQAARKALA